MTEQKTLQQLGTEAQKNYASFKRAVGAKAAAEELQSREYLQQSYRNQETHRADKKFNKAEEAAKSFYQENASELHDLAAIEAHLGGAAIKLVEPITIGQKAEGAPVEAPPTEHQ